ncbi:tRNA (N6-threonylcarbamoyladenosine(37)-N6)-methyltransferase TrmO [Catenovulum sp. SM1970]|uniref:tRNA (N6-threonylcarbamoyladenosine(37)-N6)-methyltransferase TrmO n=1 Tax=Marinifaba aquimaris TaxID=2741323 RepID=UPI0015736AB0|nr:tRNA (N6-threonylcarbamoyladenosine(37)-N6)-methyltransferase TrmO [Marinifaba aquimaris]NTS77873.1 tRNA (N6-threonylcarbamoyladenosine(37)-N6)-methyltransferase TrmO [Marinifaba aquimaris]
MTEKLTIEPIGKINTPYKEKFAIPRQPNLVPQAKGEIILSNAFSNLDCVRGLEAFSHIWLTFSFHQTRDKGWKPTVRPPRLGGNQRMGVFATRSTFRPNGLGLSVVQYHGSHIQDGKVVLSVSGMDLLDNTPIIDIKPYLSYSDSVDSHSGFAADAPSPTFEVNFSQAALCAIKQLNEKQMANMSQQVFIEFIRAVLSQDPRPSYQSVKHEDERNYHVKLANVDISFVFDNTNKTILVTAVKNI